MFRLKQIERSQRYKSAKYYLEKYMVRFYPKKKDEQENGEYNYNGRGQHTRQECNRQERIEKRKKSRIVRGRE